MKTVKVELSRLEYRILRELVHLAHDNAEKDYYFTRSGFADWLYVVAYLKEEFTKNDIDVFRYDHYKYPLHLKIYEVESLIYLLNQAKPNPLSVLKGRLILETLRFKPNPKIYKELVKYYDESVLKWLFKKDYHSLDIEEKEFVKERFFEQLNQPSDECTD